MIGRHPMRVAAVAMALAVLAGCGGNQAATEQEAAPSTTASNGASAKDVATGGEIVVGVEANPASIDYVGGNGGPADSATAYAQSMLYEGLTMQGPDARQRALWLSRSTTTRTSRSGPPSSATG